MRLVMLDISSRIYAGTRQRLRYILVGFIAAQPNRATPRRLPAAAHATLPCGRGQSKPTAAFQAVSARTAGRAGREGNHGDGGSSSAPEESANRRGKSIPLPAEGCANRGGVEQDSFVTRTGPQGTLRRGKSLVEMAGLVVRPRKRVLREDVVSHRSNGFRDDDSL